MKILDWGYWVSQHFYWQSMYNWLSNGTKFGSLTYFSVCNPAIDMGGMLDDRKTDVYELLPKHIVPATTIITSTASAKLFIKNNNLDFPLIVKPNIGLKGFKVYKLDNNDELTAFFKENDVQEREWLLQEYVAYKKEYSVLFYRYPNGGRYGVTSFIEKSYPHVIGDGQSTLEALIKKYNNYFIVKEDIYKRFEGELDSIPEKGVKVVLDYIGNYSRGAKFHSKMDYVSDEMTSMLHSFFQKVDGLNFFRIDLKANSVNDFLKGDFKILEINGMKSEPLHIYDKETTFLENYKTIKDHWKIIVNIASEQKELLEELPSTKRMLKSFLLVKKASR